MSQPKYIDSKEEFKASKGLGKKVAVKSLDNISTSAILWHLVSKHKFFLSMTVNIGFFVYFCLPFLPGLLFSMVKGGF